MFCPTFPQWEPFSRVHPWESNVLWDHLAWMYDWTLVGPLYKRLRFWWQVWRSTCLATAEDEPCSKDACLSPTKLEWSASSFGLSLSSMDEGQFISLQWCVALFHPWRLNSMSSVPVLSRPVSSSLEMDSPPGSKTWNFFLYPFFASSLWCLHLWPFPALLAHDLCYRCTKSAIALM